MKKIIFAFFCIFSVTALFSQSQNTSKEKLSPAGKSVNSFNEINREFGIEIITDVKSMIPESWVSSPVNGKAKPLAEKYYDKAAVMIKKALKEYPKDFLNEQLHGISLVDHLEFYGVEYGGTAVYEYRTLILEIKDWTSEDWLVGTIHHELNHLLVYWNDFPEAAWTSLNKSGFKYGNGGVDAIKSGQSNTERVESAFREGFANQYGKSAFVEDVATITEYAIGARGDFQKRAMKYSIIANKFSALKKFYRSLNPYFDDDFWTGNEKVKDDTKSEVIKDNVRDNSAKSTDENDISVDDNTIIFYSYLEPYVYKERFTKNETYIAYYFELDNTEAEYDSVDVRAIYYYPDGTQVGEFTKTYEPKAREKIIKCSWGFGWKTPGSWVTGKYRVEIYVNDELYAEGSFFVK